MPVATFTVRDAAGAVASTGVNFTVTGTTVGAAYGGISEPLERVQGPTRATLDQWASTAKTLGVGWLRGDYPVRQVSASRGVFNYTSTDQWVLAALAQGIKPLPIVYMLPQWMNGSTNDKAPPTVAQDYADWCATACVHWQSLGITWVEIWNEENLSGFWPTPDRARYADMFIRAADAIHAHSNVKVLIGGLSTADTQYQAGVTSVSGYTSPEVGNYCTLDLYGKLGALTHADGVGIHPYLDDYRPGVDAMPWCRWAPLSIQRAIAICDRWAPGRNLSVWNTESAYPMWNGGTETEKATRAGMAFDAFNGFLKPYRSRCGPYFWFTLRDRGTDQTQRDNTFGLMDVNWNAHPAFNTAKTSLAAQVVP
jgi:hypothetical protein